MPIIRETYPRTSKIDAHAICPKCNHGWFPFTNEIRTLPFEAPLKCPECGEIFTNFFPDARMNEEILRRKYVLNYDQKLKNAKEKNEILTKERDEWKERHDKLFENTTKLANALDRVTKKLDELGVEVDNNDRNPIAG